MNLLSNWLAYITKKSDESKSFPIQQFKMNDRTGDAYIASPYGMHSNLPVNQPALNMSSDGTILMGIDPVGRIKVEEGEVVFYHPITKSKIHFKNNKDIDIETEADINAICDNLNATATTKATITAPDIVLIGNVAITGGFTVNGKNVDETHGHTQANDSGGNTEQNTGGVV